MKLSLKHTLYIALLVAFGSRADAAALLVEGFNYAAGVGLPAPWTSSNGVILATSPGLTLPGLADTVPTGNKVSIVPNGVSSYTQTSPFTPVSSGSVYCGFLITCTALPTTSTYVIGLVTNLSLGVSGSPDPMVLYVVNVTGGFQFRIRHTGTSQLSATNVCETSITYFVVMKYTFGGAGKADLFVSPVYLATEPATPGASVSSGGTDAPNLGLLSIKSQTAITQGNWDIDSIRVGTTWADVAPTPVAVTPVPLYIQPSGTNVVLSWSSSAFALQSAPEITGVFTNMAGFSPVIDSARDSRKFYRLISNP